MRLKQVFKDSGNGNGLACKQVLEDCDSGSGLTCNPDKGGDPCLTGTDELNYNVGDKPFTLIKGNRYRQGTIDEISGSDPVRYRLVFKDKRMKSVWRTKDKLCKASRPSNSESGESRILKRTATNTTSEEGPLSRPTGGPSKKKAWAGGNGHSPVLATTLVNTGSDPLSHAQTPSPQGGKGPELIQQQPRMRAAASAAAKAISKTSRRMVSSSKSTRGNEGVRSRATSSSCISTTGPQSGTSARKRLNKETETSTTPNTPAQVAAKRPRLVTPTSLGGSLKEPALRTTHATEAMKRRAFRVQSLNAGAVAAGRGKSVRGRGRRPLLLTRPLRQPSHPFGIDSGDHTQVKEMGGEGIGAITGAGAGATGSTGRWGRPGRMRKQVHANLNESKMAALRGMDSEDSEEDEGSDGKGGGAPPLRFTEGSESAPWGSGAQPLVKLELSILADSRHLEPKEDALAKVRFVSDRHHYSGEQLVNVLISSEGFLCYCRDDNWVFVLVRRDYHEQREALKRVVELARTKCGVQVEAEVWLEGKPAVDELLDNYSRIIRHLVRHHLSTNMWSEVGGVYFHALFCGRSSKRTFQGVRLSTSLASSDRKTLQGCVWELWMTVEPAVHRFVPVDWWELLQEKEEKGLADFSGPLSDDLRENLQVVCLPNLVQGEVLDVSEGAFPMDRHQQANLRKGYLVGPRTEDEQVEYWRQVHRISLPSSSFVFVKVRIGNMVLTYPSWCVLRSCAEVPQATEALRGRILDSFADTLDGLAGVNVLETTFSWRMLPHTASFTTAKGKPVGRAAKAHASHKERVCDEEDQDLLPRRPVVEELAPEPCTPAAASRGANPTGRLGGPPTVTPSSLTTPTGLVSPRLLELPRPQSPILSGGASVSGSGGCDNNNSGSSAPSSTSKDDRAAAAAAEATVAAVIRRSRPPVIRRGVIPRAPAAAPSVFNARHARTGTSLCSSTFIVRGVPNKKSQEGVIAQPSVGGRRHEGATKTPEASPKFRSPLRKPVGITPDTSSRCGVVPKHPDNRTAGERGRVSSPAGATRPAEDARPVIPQAKQVRVPPGSGGRDADNAVGESAVVGAGTSEAGESAGTQSSSPSTPGALNEERLEEPSKRSRGGGDHQGEPEDPSNAGPTVARVAGTAGGGVGKSGSSSAESDGGEGDGKLAAPGGITIAFEQKGSLGMGLGEDDDGNVELEGKSPTSPAGRVPDGWLIAKVGGQDVLGRGGEFVATLLLERPVEVLFVPPPTSQAQPSVSSGRGKKKESKAKAKPRARQAKGKENRGKAKKVSTARGKFKKPQSIDPSGSSGGNPQGGEGGRKPEEGAEEAGEGLPEVEVENPFETKADI